MDYTPVPADEQDDIRTPRRAAWFQAVLDYGMVSTTARPTLSAAQADVLEQQGQRMRTRSVKDVDGSLCYVWFEDVPATDLSEAQALDDEDLPM